MATKRQEVEVDAAVGGEGATPPPVKRARVDDEVAGAADETPPKGCAEAAAAAVAVGGGGGGGGFAALKAGKVELDLESNEEPGKAKAKAKAKAKGAAALEREMKKAMKELKKDAKKSSAKARGRPKGKAPSKEDVAAAAAVDGTQPPAPVDAAKEGELQRQGSMKPKEIAALIEKSTPYSVSMRPAAPAASACRVLSWNINGINSLVKTHPESLKELLERERPDVLLLQETKLQEKDIEEMKAKCVPEGWGSYWACSKEKLGYSGVAALWRPGLEAKVTEGVGLEEADKEGRCLTLELPDFYVVGCYVPNAGDGLKRLDLRIKGWEPAIATHLRKLQESKPTVYCGDLNVCHRELDLWGNHSPNSKGAGYTPQERQAMSDLHANNGLADSFRYKHPDARGFSYWSFRFNGRQKNNGWRLDYCLVPSSLLPRVHDAFILPDVMGSDHCPVGIIIV